MRKHPIARDLLLGLLLTACQDTGATDRVSRTATNQSLQLEVGKHALSYEYARLESLPAGVAGDEQLVFVGAPLEGRVLVLSRLTGRPLAELPAPEGGFVLPFIMHSLGPGKLAVLDAGGLPSPDPFVPANPTIYEYSYAFHRSTGFSAQLTKAVSFAAVSIGFAEDFVALDDGSYLLSDAILGAIWIAAADGSIEPGIAAQSSAPEDAIPQLAFCPSMPLIQVGGLPFLFSGSSLPGVSPLAVRNDTLYFYSPCAAGLFSVPLTVLFDDRQPYERAADIHIVSAKAPNVTVEQLLALTFNPYDPTDDYIYAADSLQLRLIRIDVTTGRHQVLGDDERLFNFPSSMSFLPSVVGLAPLVVVSNQQHRNPLTNIAIADDVSQLPYVITKTYLKN
jgi:hypothetical protein